MRVTTFPFGALSDGREVTAARLETTAGASVTVLDYGASVQALCVPDRDGALRDVVLGYDSAAEYEKNDAYLGATIGRVGNRIGGAVFSLNGVTYPLAKNDGENHLHGGQRGFDKQFWKLDAAEDRIVCTRVSPDGEEGYPGALHVSVCFTLTEDNALRIRYDADTDKDTLVNLTNHSYFNLSGGGSVLGHRLRVNAERFCEGDAGCLPTGTLLDVAGTPFDFRQEKALGDDIGAGDVQLQRAGGYDHNFCLSGRQAAVLYSPDTGIEMRVETDLPGMQVYTGNFLTKRNGKGGSVIDWRGAVCLETQLYPNALACYGFPSPVLRAGQHLRSETAYCFSCR